MVLNRVSYETLTSLSVFFSEKNMEFKGKLEFRILFIFTFCLPPVMTEEYVFLDNMQEFNLRGSEFPA